MLTRLFLALIAGRFISLISWYLQPAIVQGLVSVRHLTDSQAGVAVAVEAGAAAVGCLVSARIMRTVPLLYPAVLGGCVAVLATAASVVMVDYSSLVLTRLIAGIGEGAILMVSTAGVARFRQPDRVFAAVMISGNLLISGFIAALPVITLLLKLNTTSAFPALLTGILLFLPFLLLIPRGWRLEPSPARDRTAHKAKDVGPSNSLNVLGICTAAFLQMMSFTVSYAFYGILGSRAGLDQIGVNNAIAFAVFAGLAGTALVILISTSFGRFIPTSLGFVVSTLALVVLYLFPDPWVFRISLAAFFVCFGLTAPFLTGYGVASDSSGRGAALVNGSFQLAATVGPFVGGLIFQYAGIPLLNAVTIGDGAGALVILIVVNRRLHRAPAATISVA